MRIFTLVCIIIGLSSVGAFAETVELNPDRDNTLYEFMAGEHSNGAGAYIFAGQSRANGAKRALLRFNLSPIPAGSTIESVSLRLHMSRTTAPTRTFGLHRTARNWGEGISDAGDPGGAGVTAEPGDATWLHTFYPSQFWTTPGGDFAPTPSASRTIGGVGYYTFSTTSSLVADVQAWLDNPNVNFGWTIVGVGTSQSAKRFDSRENLTPEFRPLLSVVYTPIPEPSTALLLLAAAGVVLRRR